LAPVVVIDTNVWVSAFLNPQGFPARLVALAKADRFAVVVSAPLLQELYAVLCRPRIRKVRQTTEAEAEAFVRGVAAVSRLIPVTGSLRLSRDPDDDVVAETAIAGGASHIVSRDEDVTRDLQLISRLAERGVQVITVSRFLAMLGV